MNRSPLAPIGCKATSFSQKKTIDDSKENKSPNRSKKCSPKKKVLNPKSTSEHNPGPKVIDINASVITNEDCKLSLTPRLAMLEKDTSELFTRLEASYKTSRDVLQEIIKEKADIMDLSPLKVYEGAGELKEFGEVSSYCKGKTFGNFDDVKLDVFREVSSYCMDKMMILSNTSELDAIKEEKDALLIENSQLREQIEFKSACYIQAEASIASMIKLIKEKEAALDEYDEYVRMNDTANAYIVASMKQQYEEQIAFLNEEILSRKEEIDYLEHYKGMCKIKDRQLESAVQTVANLERSENDNFDLHELAKTQASRIEYLTSLNDEVNQVVASLTTMLHEKEVALNEWASFSQINEKATSNLFEHIGKKHQMELQENNDTINGLIGIIKRQKCCEKEKLQLELEIMKQRLDTFDRDDQKLWDFVLILAVVTVSSGLLLLFWGSMGGDFYFNPL
eukprot:scaffold5766_cov64-Cyclotella_meneghiniana.AAC.12